MQSIDMEFVKNLMASFQELQRSYAALQKRMADFGDKSLLLTEVLLKVRAKKKVAFLS